MQAQVTPNKKPSQTTGLNLPTEGRNQKVEKNMALKPVKWRPQTEQVRKQMKRLRNTM